ncbi:hypothetical protein ACFVQ4_11145 [Streptomyces laurentii]|uniref:hypothetical protein n=1 Tax=Streptomyces laurentii TaxID=39478 RepID=UPI0036B6EB2D
MDADEDDQVDLWDDEAGDLVLAEAALDCWDLLPGLVGPVTAFLDDPDGEIRASAWSTVAELLPHPDAADRAPALLPRLYAQALAALPYAFRLSPCPELGPYLRVAFPDGLPADPTPEQRGLAAELAARDELWDPVNGNRRITLRGLGLPDDREAWRAFSRG